MSENAEFEHAYPEVTALGSLAAAIEAAGARQGRLVVAVRPSQDLPTTAATVLSATVSRNDLSVSALGAERRFHIQGWGLGMCLVFGDTDDLGQVVQAAHSWSIGVPLHAIRQSVPFVRLTGRGEVAEQGPAHVVTAEWQQVRQRVEQGDDPNQRKLIEAAYGEPRLRQLYPYTSHQVLSFSTTTGYPFSPSPVSLDACSGYAIYRVFKRGGALLGETLIAEEAVALAVMHLPVDLGPAVAGPYAGAD